MRLSSGEAILHVQNLSRRDEYTEATRTALVVAARAMFAAKGFAGTSAESISRAARVTRGAFYHHFKDKVAAFDAVVVEMQRDAAAEIARTSGSAKGSWAKLEAGLDAYLDVCVRPEYARIVISEASSVLGGARYREIDEASVLALLRASLEALRARNRIFVDDVSLLAGAVDAIICYAAAAIVAAENQPELRERFKAIVLTLIRAHAKNA